MRSERLLPLYAVVGLGCLGSSSGPAVPDAAPLRPITQAMQIQAAHNDTTLFLHARWSSDSTAPGLAVALSTRAPATKVRGFATAGCFLGCHDRASDMPNWLPADGDRPMYLLPGFGGPADVWDWRAQAANPAGQIADRSLGTAGLRDDPDGGADTLAGVGSVAPGIWDVVYTRNLFATGAGDVPLAPGNVYDLAFALHPDGVSGRNHYVSLPISLGLGTPGAQLVAVSLAGATAPDFSDVATFPPLAVDLFLPGITSFEFLVGAVVDRDGRLRNNDYRHGGGHAVSTGALACSDCHRVTSDGILPAAENAGALERLVLRRGGVFGPPNVEVAP